MSAFSLDEAIKNVDDETAVNQLVGSLEKTLERQNSGMVQYYRNKNSDVNGIRDDLTTSSSVDSLNYVSPFPSNSANFIKTNQIESNNNVQSVVNNNQHHQQAAISHQQIFTNFIQNNGQQHHQQQQTIQQRIIGTGGNPLEGKLNMPKNEPVKLVYPIGSQSSATTVLSMNNNRVTFTNASQGPAVVQNGTITLSQMTASGQHQQQQQPTAMMQGTNIKITGQPGGQQAPTLIFKNANTSTPGTIITSSTPGIVTMSKSINNQASTPNIVALPSNLLVNIRPQVGGNQAGQKTTVGQQRVVNVINQQVVRPQNNTITLQNLPQNMGNTILLKQDNGSYQLLRISAAQPSGNQQVSAPGLTPSAGSTIRLQTVPALTNNQHHLFTRQSIAPSNTILVNTSASSTPNQHQILTTQSTPIVSATQVPALTTVQSAQQSSVASGGNATVIPTTGNVTIGQSPAQRNDNAKDKCRRFLTNLIELSKREPPQVEMNVRTLIQELVDANVGPEDFCKKLENLLNAAPQPCLIGFLKKSLPLLRQSLVTKETVIEGINPPSPSVAFSGATITTTQIPAQIRPLGQTIVSTGSIGQTQIRMVQPGTAPRIGQTTIRPTAPQMIRTAAPTMRPLTTIRGQTTIVQTNNQVPALHPVSGATIISTQGSMKAKEKKTLLASVVQQVSAASANASGSGSNAMSSFYPSSSTFGDDDINDVAAMGGVNLAEESQRILGSTEFVGTQIRSCKDEVLLNLPILQQRIRQQMARHGLDDPSTDIAVLISHAAQERLKNIIEKLAVIAEHRIDILKIDPRYEMTTDVRGQIKFLEELDKAEQKRHEEVEREILLRAAKSRSKTEDPEQAKLKAKAKEMQRAEMEELRHREANNTALQAIGPRKKPKLDSDVTGTSVSATGNTGSLGSTPGTKTTTVPRPRIKRVNMRDMIFYMEQEKDSCRSSMLYKAYLK